jgi:hypothetical protein
LVTSTPLKRSKLRTLVCNGSAGGSTDWFQKRSVLAEHTRADKSTFLSDVVDAASCFSRPRRDNRDEVVVVVPSKVQKSTVALNRTKRGIRMVFGLGQFAANAVLYTKPGLALKML